jgi:hypothetical protein
MTPGYNMNYGVPSGKTLSQLPNFTGGQMDIFNSLQSQAQRAQGGLGKGVDYLSGLAGGDDSAFAEMEKPYYSQLQKALGKVGSRFAGTNSLNSSAFQNAASGEAGSLAEILGSRRNDIRQQSIRDLLGISNSVLQQQPYSNYMQDEDQGFDWGSLLGTVGGSALGSFFGPLGSTLGSGIGEATLPALLKSLGIGGGSKSSAGMGSSAGMFNAGGASGRMGVR